MSVFVSPVSVFIFCLCYSAVHAADSERGLDAAAQFWESNSFAEKQVKASYVLCLIRMQSKLTEWTKYF